MFLYIGRVQFIEKSWNNCINYQLILNIIMLLYLIKNKQGLLFNTNMFQQILISVNVIQL